MGREIERAKKRILAARKKSGQIILQLQRDSLALHLKARDEMQALYDKTWNDIVIVKNDEMESAQ